MSPDGRVSELLDASEPPADTDAAYRVTYRRWVEYRGLFLAVERRERQILEIHQDWWPYPPSSWPYQPWDTRKKLVEWLANRRPEVFARPRGHQIDHGERGGQDATGWHEAVQYWRRLPLGYAGNTLTLLCLGVFLIGLKERLSTWRRAKALRASVNPAPKAEERRPAGA